MTRFLRLGPLVLVASILAGCGSEGADTTSSTTLTEGPAEPISYRIYVGYPPILRSIEIDAEGNATTRAQYREDEKERIEKITVPEDELSSIRDHLASSDLSELPSEGCTDCVFVTLTYGDEEAGGDTNFLPEDTEGTPENLRIAIEMITELLPPLKEPGNAGGA